MIVQKIVSFILIHKRKFVGSFWLFVLLPLTLFAEMRQWRSLAGSTIEAKLIEDLFGRVILETANGRRIDIIRHHMSLEDQAYLSDLKNVGVDEAATLEAQVAALPAATLEDGVKRAVLELALERADHALDISLDTEAQSLIDDVEAALAQSAADFAQRNPVADNLAILKPLLTATNNPYLDAMVLEAKEALESTDIAWSRATAGNPTFSGLNGSYGVRNALELARTFFWLFAHEQSPMRYDPKLLKRVLRRAHAYVDAINLDPAGDIEAPVVMDQFCVEAAFSLLFEIYELYPGLLLPSEKLVWDNAMIAATTEMYTWAHMAEGYSPWNYNIETARMVGAINVGLYTENQTFIDRVLAHVDKVILLQRPDGAVPYHGKGNPSVNYHNALFGSWLRIYEQTGHEPIAAALEASQWKGPVMGRADEFWTSPHYKAWRWNFQKGTEVGPEAVAALSENPYLRWMLDHEGTAGIDRDQVAWYRSDIPAQPLPDNYTIPDHNIGGPRAWYGEFCYAGAFRPNPAGMEGRETLMGAMTVDPADGRLNSILADVTPRIWMTPDPYLNGDGQEVSAWGVLTANETAATTITRNYSVGTSVHDITATRGGAYQGPFSEWKGRQIWIGLPDRIVGLVSTVPSVGSAEAYAVNGVVRLISGGSTGAETTKVLTTVGPGHYRYGQLDILVHDSTYTSLNGFEVEYRRAKYPATELTFSDRASEPAAVGELNNYPAKTDLRFVIEVRPTWTTTDLTSVSVLGDQQVVGLEVVGTDRSFQVWLNTTDRNRQVAIERNNLPAGDDSFTLSDGVLGKAPFDPVIPWKVKLLPGQHCLLVVSSDPADHEPGWESFESMSMVIPRTVAGLTVQEGDSSDEVSATPLASLMSYDLSLLDNTTDGAPFNTTMIYPDTYVGGVVVKDPFDDNGYMDRMKWVAFGDIASNGDRRKIQISSGNLHPQVDQKAGFTGAEMLNTEETDGVVYFKNSGTVHYQSLDAIFWIGRTGADESGNQTSFNDLAYGFKVTDNGNGIVDAGDVLRLVGIVYSTGTESVFGKTADELTAALSQSGYDISASGFGLSGSDVADDFDYDADGLVNLGEHAFGGSPIDGGDIGVQP